MHKDNKLNILIPMAGEGSRFAAMGYSFPKPLIDIKGKPMIQLVVESLNIDANYTFIVQKDHLDKYDLKNILERIAPGCRIIPLEEKTEGAAKTAWLAEPYLNNNTPLLIANCDQLVDWKPDTVLRHWMREDADGGMVLFRASHPKWSYATIGQAGWIERVAEKQVISPFATVGIYYWRYGDLFFDSALEMFNANIRTNNEFYIAPTFNHLIAGGAKIMPFIITKMQGLGTPEDLQEYLRNG